MNTRARILLNMIVKNESKIILRALESAAPFIDGLVIMDTGSSDNTIELIQGFMAKYPALFGRVISEPIPEDDFTFSGARTRALEHCVEFANNADYVLFMDADMVLEIGDPLLSINITEPPKAYYIVQKSTIFNKNVRLIPLIAKDIKSGNLKYRTYTHEFISHNYELIHIPYEKLGIRDIGDGGAKGNKLQRDLRLLMRGLKEDDADLRCRYLFYLGETNRFWADCNHEPEIRNAILTLSIKYYTERAAITDAWIQEVWFSYYAIGKCYMAMTPAQPDKAIYNWMLGYDVYPHRIENLYECIDYFCMNVRKYKLAHFYYNLAAAMLEDGDCSRQDVRETQLFLQHDIYEYKLQFIYTILAPYMGIRDLNNEIVALLNNPHVPDYIYASILNNMKYYNTQLNTEDTAIIQYPLVLPGDASANFVNSSACIVDASDGLMLWVRYVNYRINRGTGAYTLLPEGETRIITRNVLYNLTKAFQIKSGSGRELCIKQTDIDDLEVRDTQYVGIEDIRAFNPKGSQDTFFMGTGWHHSTQSLGLMFGKYEGGDCETVKEITQGFKPPQQCEKNWVFCDYGGQMCIVYEWYGRVEGSDDGHVVICNPRCGDSVAPIILQRCATKPVPPIFRYARGSSSGVWCGNDEIWFLVHLVAYGSPRHYYHMFAVFDADMNFKAHSAPFNFENTAIEYCLSLYALKDKTRLAACYSTWDSCTKIAIYNLDDIILYPTSPRLPL